jgi:hypothetical protein
MAESAVIGEIPDGVAIVDEYIKVRHGAEHRAYEQRLAALTGWCDCASDAGAKCCLSYRIHSSSADTGSLHVAGPVGPIPTLRCRSSSKNDALLLLASSGME